MKRKLFLVVVLLCAFLISCSRTGLEAEVRITPPSSFSQPAPGTPHPGSRYDTGNPAVVDLFVSPNGSDENDGLSRAAPFQTIGAAWAVIPEQAQGSTGYQVNLLPGNYPCEGDCMNYFAERHGSYESPILLKALDGPGTVTLLGGLNLFNISYLYLLDLTLEAGVEAGAAFGNNVLHIEKGDHILMRGLALHGPQGCTSDACNDIQEVLKVNQSRYVFLEDSQLSGAYQTLLDYVSVQYGHILGSRLQRSGGRCAYLKGGSAYFRVEGNLFSDCAEAGFQAGEGTNLAFMQPPWLHYEAYDIKVVNNLFNDIYGAGLSVSGGYNILMAYNTLYRVGLEDASGRTWGLVQLIHGMRSCNAIEELGGDSGTKKHCQQLLDQGAWGTAVLGEDNGGAWIPNRNVYIMNNLFFNPDTGTRYIQFVVNGPVTPPKQAKNLPNPSRTDDNLLVRGNVIWNWPVEDGGLLGDNNGSGNIGCQDEHDTCNINQLAAENSINMYEPELVDPAGGDFHPTSGSSLADYPAVPIPDFTWEDAPSSPQIPPGILDNQVPVDYDGRPRSLDGTVGAFTW